MATNVNNDTQPVNRGVERFGACEVHDFAGSITAYGLPFVARTPADLRKQAAMLEGAAAYMEKQQADAAEIKAERDEARRRGRR